MILNIDGFDNTPTDIKKNSIGALYLCDSELRKGFLTKTTLQESFSEGFSIIYIKFWFYYVEGSGKFFSVNENKFNLFLDSGMLQVRVADQIRNVVDLEPNKWHLISVKVSTGQHAFWAVEANGAKILEVSEIFELNYFVTMKAEGLVAYFDDLIISDNAINEENQVWPINKNIKLKQFWNNDLTTKNKKAILIYNIERTGNVKVYKVFIKCECKNNSKFNLQIRNSSRLDYQTANSNSVIEKLIIPQNNIEFAIKGEANEGEIILKDFQIQALY